MLWGFVPRHSVNWIWVVGEGEKAVMVMGCRVNYICVCKTKPSSKNTFIVED